MLPMERKPLHENTMDELVRLAQSEVLNGILNRDVQQAVFRVVQMSVQWTKEREEMKRKEQGE